MKTQRVVVDPGRQQRFHRRAHDIYHFTLQGTHDEQDLHLVVDVECTQNQNWDNTTTGGWSDHPPIRAGP